MRNIFTDLPDAVLRHKLSPFLDYNDRLALNACLPPAYRIGKRMKSEAFIFADMIVAIKNLKKPLKLMGKLKVGTVALANAIYRYLTVHMPANLVLIRYDTRFRRTLLERLDYFSSSEAFVNVNLSAEFQDKMYAACHSLKATIEREYSFIRSIKLPVVDKYSFVDCDLPQIVVGLGNGSQKYKPWLKRLRLTTVMQ